MAAVTGASLADSEGVSHDDIHALCMPLKEMPADVKEADIINATPESEERSQLRRKGHTSRVPYL